ncbi:MAG: U32 family peptidase [Tannerella sp.]|jgi:putative protease|nr:U32 family peptidase [Tannerella sp.]
MILARPIELLAPAKDLNCGMEAVRHGADAVYIGAPKFGARKAAGNSIDDIRALCDFAHIYNVRVRVALNTILSDDELPEAERLIRCLYDAGADAVIIQDMGILRLDLPPVPLHASTQTDNCTPEKVRFLHDAGFAQIILARELSLDEMATIAEYTPDATLEAFIHGALCVSYSGRCYLSEALNGRSANRGECAQCCRLPYSLVDADEKSIVENKHLLSLKDLNRADDLEAMMQAGISSFKIEGRLKDVSYVKNITAYYRKRLDGIFAKNPLFYRSSAGHSSFTFEPQPEKSFNRSFTSYFLHGRNAEITSFDTPKSIGEYIGVAKEVKGNSFTIAGFKPVHNGDGLVYFNMKGILDGMRVNRAEANRIFPHKMPDIKPKMQLYRNYDQVFETILERPSAERKIDATVEWGDYPDGFVLTMTDESDARVTIVRPFDKETARKPQNENIRTQLGKLGNTPFEAKEILISTSENFFVPSSLLNEMRRDAVDKLISVRRMRYSRRYAKKSVYDNKAEYPAKSLDYTANVFNRNAEEFYRLHGVETFEKDRETSVIASLRSNPLTINDLDCFVPRNDGNRSNSGKALMYTKHCIRYSMGWCPVHHKTKSPYKEPFFLIHNNNRLRLSFDCNKCLMLVYNS